MTKPSSFFSQTTKLAIGSTLFWASPAFCDSGKELVDNFLEQLDQSTEIATKNGLNIDFVPGNVSVISGEELKRLGYQTLNATRFDMILGIESPVNSMRGTGGSYSRQKILLLLNGVEIDNQTFGTNYYGAMSVDLVDRVEIIRGPGSSVYGGYAVNGVINVITKKEPHVIS